jgi:hypothetical protein
MCTVVISLEKCNPLTFSYNRALTHTRTHLTLIKDRARGELMSLSQEALSRLRTRSRFLLSGHTVVVVSLRAPHVLLHVWQFKIQKSFKILFCNRQINMQRYLLSSRSARVSGHAHTCTHIKCAVCKFISL